MAYFKTDEIYKLELYNGNSASAQAYVDLLVMDNSHSIFLANMIGTDSKVKDAAWALQEGKTGRLTRAEGDRYEEGHLNLSIYALNERSKLYDEETSKIEDLTQILSVARNAKPDPKARKQFLEDNERRREMGYAPYPFPDHLAEFILAWDGDYRKQVYDVLNDRYNTPMLEEWKDYIIDALIDGGFYEKLNVYLFGSDYQLEAGLLKVTEENLETIISEAIQGYELEFAIEEDGRDPDEGVLNNIQSIDDYLTHFAPELGARIQENVGLRFDPDKDKHHPAFHDINLQANKNGVTGLYPPQANTAMGIARTLVEDSFCFNIGEMGTGKTPIGAILPYITEAMIQKVEHNPNPERVIALVPSIMVEKWSREVKERIPNCETYIIAHWTDVKEIQEKYQYIDYKGKVKYKKPKQWEFYIMSSETPKFTYPKEAIKDWRTHPSDIPSLSVEEVHEDQRRFVTRMVQKEDGSYKMEKQVVVNPEHRIRMQQEILENYAEGTEHEIYTSGETGYYCPKCGGPLTKRNNEMSNEYFFDSYNKNSRKWTKKVTQENWVCDNEIDTAWLPKEEIKEWELNKITNRYEPKHPMQKCGFVLWQPEKLPKDSGYRKVSPAWYINKKLPRGFFKYLIADEVHEYKSGDSSTGQAFGQLINHTEKQILLTGTLMGGMSKDIFYLLARLNPKGLLKEGIRYQDESVFNQRYGISEYNTRFSEGTAKKSSNQKPGISPHLFPMYLMSNCAFLELNDMGYALPPYQEIPEVVEMSQEQRTAYRETAFETMSKMRRTEGLGGMNSISIHMNAMYQYVDAPFNIDAITAYDQSGTEHTLCHPINFDPDTFIPPKVERLIQNIDENLYNPEPMFDKNGEQLPSVKRKSLVYVKYTGSQAWNQMDTYLYDILKRRGYKVGILRNGKSYDGIKMPRRSRDREEWLNNMMEKHDWDVLITNPRLVKVGLDLLSFPNIHFFQLDYSTYDYLQASRRSWRLKQTLPVKVYTYVYHDTIQEKALQHIAKKIDAAMAMQGKFSEEGLRAMSDSSDGMNALAKQLMNDEVLEEIETVHDMFSRKNASFEEMQSVEFQDYDGYVMNPIEGGIDEVRRIAEQMIRTVEEDAKAGFATEEDVKRTRQTFTNYLDMFESVMKTKSSDEVKAYNKGVSKKKKVIEGQQELDLFAI